MKTILTTFIVLLLFCGFSNNNLYAKPSDNMINSSISGTFDKNYPMQYDGRNLNVRVIWEMEDGNIYNALGGVAGESLFTAKDVCTFDASGMVYLTVYLEDQKNRKKIEITGFVNTITGYAEFELIDHGKGQWPWPHE
ncbi:hypothetical protein NXY11_16770 [Parabacteroides faecis]|uniref:hypothetical protein n=1 Tax=Parabacteroides faecis TaxID=1217282 RepID=UPI002164EA8C|nr:hypothetical protein [Parabacteroides faecis]MCS2891523.1 hypothetical protein [Parabacteroides faecis]UVQ44840.1 hypothetical protein NXY11_16770 [Parabacteroides faecis]